MAAQPLVLTVHGINTDGEWQGRVESKLGPHCICDHFRYTDYRYAGFTLQLIGPRAAVLAAGLIGFALAWLLQNRDGVKPWIPQIQSQPAVGEHGGDYQSVFLWAIWIVGQILPLLLGCIFLLRSWVLAMSLPMAKAPPQMRFFLRLFVVAIRSILFSRKDFERWALPCLGFLVAILPLVGSGFIQGPLYSLLPSIGVAFLMFSLDQKIAPWWRTVALWICPALVLIDLRLLHVETLWIWILTIALCFAWGLFVVWTSKEAGKAMANEVKTGLLPLGCLIVACWAGIGVYGLVSEFPVMASYWVLLICLTLVGVVLALGIWEAASRRKECAARFKEWLLDRVREHKAGPDQEHARPVHLIAHSFGTFLTGEALLNQPRDVARQLRVCNIILVGSVLPSKYTWNDVLTSVKGNAFCQVRNEVGGRDWVVGLAGLTQNGLQPFRWLAIPWSVLSFLGFGKSGHDGFVGDMVHNVDNPLDYCVDCPVPEDRRIPRVHNHYLRTFLHSDAFSTENHAATLWLPFLLGYHTWDYWDFHRLCAQAKAYENRQEQAKKEASSAETQQNRDLADLDQCRAPANSPERDGIEEAYKSSTDKLKKANGKTLSLQEKISSVERQLKESFWDWIYDGKRTDDSLGQYFARKCSEFLRQSDTSGLGPDKKQKKAEKQAEVHVPRAVRYVWTWVAKGQESAKNLSGSGEEASSLDAPKKEMRLEEMRLLDPRVAIEKAWESLQSDMLAQASAPALPPQSQ